MSKGLKNQAAREQRNTETLEQAIARVARRRLGHGGLGMLGAVDYVEAKGSQADKAKARQAREVSNG
jgi:hypothetical protein